MLNKFITPLILLVFISCARVQTLNMEKHYYSERPQHILWFQIAGFSEEHIPLLRFNVPESGYRTNLEKIDCLGKMWVYNLYDLRPEASRSFMSQINGSKNIKGQCNDYESKPVWDYFSEMGHGASILEAGASDEQSLESALKCSGNATIDLNKVRLYRMGPLAQGPGSLVHKSFHYQDTLNGLIEINNPGLYYDKSCQKDLCYSSVSNNFKTLWSQTLKTQIRSFFLVRDFNFYRALKKKDVVFAKESLQELERIISWVRSQKRDDVLIVITGAETINLEYPKEGKEWSEYEKSGKNLFYKNPSLMSPVLAQGPMSENFCGLFEESDILKRLIYKPEKKQFSWDLLSPL